MGGHQGTYSRGYVPHFDHEGVIQAVTFRLGDALPQGVGTRLEFGDYDGHLDRGHGSCLLQSPDVAAIVAGSLRFFDGKRYALGPWVIMPNHVHVLLRPFPGQALSTILHSWKSFTAKRIHSVVGSCGTLWQREYFDRMIRNRRHLLVTAQYIHDNPVRAGLVQHAEDWPFSTAREPLRIRTLLDNPSP
jgi:REP element-mobilizing transposase RayT